MEVAAAFTVWLSFGTWLFLPTVHAPAFFGRVAISLCSAEMLAVAIWCFGAQGCERRPCALVPETARTAAALDIPALTGLGLVLAAAYGLRAAQAWYESPDAHPRNRSPRQGRRGRDPRPDRGRP